MTDDDLHAVLTVAHAEVVSVSCLGGLRVFTVHDLALDDVDAYDLNPNYARSVGTLVVGERATPVLTLTPETEDACIEDFRMRTGWALIGIVRTDANGVVGSSCGGRSRS
ncbi:hypothetical protein [Streptomyces sp. NPDC006335]|uniref:hypothetical protein n=1 Tax=Streptomyces sp. NPDC006335 TaxID=3156895 RepID=UPI0033AE2B21